MGRNKKAKKELIRRFGNICFIEALHLRENKTETRYKSKGQLRRMKQITFHHIMRKEDGGESTFENGAVLREENHLWFHSQPVEEQERMNRLFQKYKECPVTYVDDVKTDIEVRASIFIPMRLFEEKRYNRKRIKRETRKMLDDYYKED